MIEQILILILFLFLLVITGGVIYITWNEFRDRRRRKQPANPITARPPQTPRTTGKKRRRSKINS